MLDGGLTRSNLILALRALDMTNPQLLPGVRYNMRGNTDAYLIEGSFEKEADGEWRVVRAKQRPISPTDLL